MCEYCEKNNLIIDELRWDVYVLGKKLHIGMLEGEYMNSIHVAINYCPMCGRKLKEEE